MEFKVKGLSSWFVLSLKMPGDNCSISNWDTSRGASGISFFRVSTKDEAYSRNWRNNIVAVVTCDRVI